MFDHFYIKLQSWSKQSGNSAKRWLAVPIFDWTTPIQNTQTQCRARTLSPENGGRNPDGCDKAVADLASKGSEDVVVRPRRHAVGKSPFSGRNHIGGGSVTAVPEVQALQRETAERRSVTDLRLLWPRNLRGPASRPHQFPQHFWVPMVAQVPGPKWIGTLLNFVYFCLVDDEIRKNGILVQRENEQETEFKLSVFVS